MKNFSLFFLLFICVSGFGADLSVQVQKILEKNCAECHGAKGDKSAGIDFIEDVERVKEEGLVIAKDPANSPLYQRLIETDESKRMPFGEDPLSQQDIALIAKWITEGAVTGKEAADFGKRWTVGDA